MTTRRRLLGLGALLPFTALFKRMREALPIEKPMLPMIAPERLKEFRRPMYRGSIACYASFTAL